MTKTTTINPIQETTPLSGYTAKLWHQEVLVTEIEGQDVVALQTQLLLKLDEAGSGHQGEIIDNATGAVVHRARYSAVG